MKRFKSLITVCTLGILSSCNNETNTPPSELIASMNLKTGNIIVCGPSESQFGKVDFLVTSSEEVKNEFNLATAMLHSFEYDEAEKMFASIIEKEPDCAMAYWGVAMSNFHPLWAAPTQEEMKKGSKAVEIARSIKQKTAREAEYIEAIGSFYDNYETIDHITRCKTYELSMEKVYKNNPKDNEAAILYALALNTTAPPTDKTYANQKKAVEILNSIYNNNPDHPGIFHYIIHNYDYPELAELALPAARKYASIAPSSAHAQHMPSHIFIRLGYWDESIKSNEASKNSAKCYAESSGIKGHWDEELHAMDYLVYAFLQQGKNDKAKEHFDYLKTIKTVYPVNFKVAYSFAAIPSRFYLENRLWKEASEMELPVANFDWNKFPWQKAVNHFTRLLGYINLNNINSASNELAKLRVIHDTLVNRKSEYDANQVAIQIKAGDAWIKMKQGNKDEALALMKEAADMEDATAKHPVTPGEMLPARELLGDMYMELNSYEQALATYETNLSKLPNRFNGLFGAARAAELLGNKEKAKSYYTKLVSVAGSSGRQELKHASVYLQKHSS